MCWFWGTGVRKQLVGFLLGLALLGFSVAIRIIDPEPIARLRLSIFDAYQRATRAIDAADRVTIVQIDNESLERVGQWPWPRTQLAQMIDRLREAGARAIALDLVLAEPDRLSIKTVASLLEGSPDLARILEQIGKLPSNDDRLATAIEKAPTVLGFVADNGLPRQIAAAKSKLAFAGDDPKLFAPAFPGATTSLPILTQRAAGIGSVNWLPTSDLIVRRVPLLVSVGSALYPSLALEAARVGLNQSTIFVQSSGGSGMPAFGQKNGVEFVRLGSLAIPTDRNGEMWIRFRERNAASDIPAHRVLDGTFDKTRVEGRFLLIGVSAPGLLDLRATPVDSAVPGVAIHAQALEQILSGAHLSRPAYATGMEILFLLAVGASVLLLLQRFGPVIALMTAAAAIIGVTAVSWFAYVRQGMLFDPVYPSLALIAIYLASSFTSYIRSEMERSFVRSAFSHYLAPSLVEQLANNHDRLRLGGEMRDITVLFADVRGFSRISEGLDAEELIHLVNEIFTPLSAVVLAERGTIDKFIGDAIMAFWNAPIADAHHAQNAARAALSMLQAIDALNRLRAAHASARGETAAPIRIGIGLNTGECCVGNVGSPQRFDYSILGDPVNVASRLQDATKTFGVPIIAGERTAREASALAFIEIDVVTLRGKEQPERIFALIGDETVARSERFRALQASILTLHAAIAAGERAIAEACLEKCRSIGWPGLETLLDTYSSRIP
jgi:adenylate cyclase